MSDLSEAETSKHVPAAIETIQARRRLGLFRSLSAAVIMTVATVLAVLVCVSLLNFSFSSPTVLAISLSGLIGFSIVLLSGVQLGLEVPARRWFLTSREARQTLDREQAADKELLDRRNADRAATRLNYMQNIEGPDFGFSYQAQRVAREDRENELWSSENYGFVNRLVVERMQAEIEHQGSRANTNLTIALVVAFVGIIILAWLSYDVTNFLSKPPTHTENQMLFYVGSFLAKLTLAISANVFAFFFLSTYRRNLNEIRYFHNELTNYEAKIVGAYLAGHHKLDKPLSDSLSALSKTERNFILKRGETTSDLSTKGLDQDETKNMIASLASITKFLERAGLNGLYNTKSVIKQADAQP
jgi:hypothetical protein